jgi:hypothetical protein
MSGRTALAALVVLLILGTVAESRAQERTDGLSLRDRSSFIGSGMRWVAEKDMDGIVASDTGFGCASGRMEPLTRVSSSAPARLKRKKFPEVGISIGTPAGLNFSLGYWFGAVNGRISGMYWGRLNGLQGDFGYRMFDNGRWNHALALVVGRLENEDGHWLYVGPAYELRFGGLFLEGGLAIGSGIYTGPQVVVQFGYSYRFLQR